MAYIPRSIAVIQNQIIEALGNYPALSALIVNTSKVNKAVNWTYIQALMINALENIVSILQSEIEDTVAHAAPETPLWIQRQVLNFQYNSTTPQVVQINEDFSISYPVITESYRIVTACAVVPNGSGGLVIKVATGSAGSLAPITSPQLVALQSYLNTILGADIYSTATSNNADTLDITGAIYYNGQYSGSIEQDITSAINNYLAAIPFNGVVRVSEIYNAIKSVAGCTDFVPSDISATPDGGSPVYMVQSSEILDGNYQTNSGYINAGTLTFTFTVLNN